MKSPFGPFKTAHFKATTPWIIGTRLNKGFGFATPKWTKAAVKNSLV
jgi:hypothetical protein